MHIFRNGKTCFFLQRFSGKTKGRCSDIQVGACESRELISGEVQRAKGKQLYEMHR